jgi:hypothetical protein
MRTKTLLRLNVLKSLAGMKWTADQGMLVKVHEMLVLSALEYGSVAYGSARDGIRIAIAAFCVCKTENLLCESGFENLAEKRRRRRIINIAIHVAENQSHPVNKLFGESEAFDYYAEKMRSTKPFSIRALEACASLNVDLNIAEKTRREEHPPWI